MQQRSIPHEIIRRGQVQTPKSKSLIGRALGIGGMTLVLTSAIQNDSTLIVDIGEVMYMEEGRYIALSSWCAASDAL